MKEIMCPLIAAYRVELRRVRLSGNDAARIAGESMLLRGLIVLHVLRSEQCPDRKGNRGKPVPASCIEQAQVKIDDGGIVRAELAGNEANAFNDVFTASEPKVSELIKLLMHDGRFDRALANDLRGMTLEDALDFVSSELWAIEIDADEWLRKRNIIE